MSDNLIRDALAEQYRQVAGVVEVFSETPEKPPENSQCPALVVRYADPACTVLPMGGGMTLYRWHYEVTVCLFPIGVTTAGGREQLVETLFPRLTARLNAHASLNGAVKTVVFNRDVKVGNFNFLGTDYFGFVYIQDVDKYTAETYAA